MMSRTRCVAALLVSLALLLQGCDTTPAKPVQPPAAQTLPTVPETVPPTTESVTPSAELPAPPAEPEPATQLKPEPEPPVVCEPPPAPPAPPAVKRPPPQTALAVLGEIESVSIDPPGMHFTARLDTGSATSAIHALDVRAFERDGKTWVKFQLVDAGSGKSVEVSRPVVRTYALKDPANPKRYVVSLKTTIDGIEQFTNFTLTDRSANRYPALIGRNFLRDQAVVDVGRRYTKPDTKP